jgi:hypothetical protein
LRDDERYRAVQEDQEAYAEERDTKQIGCDLGPRRGKSKAEHDCDELARA